MPPNVCHLKPPSHPALLWIGHGLGAFIFLSVSKMFSLCVCSIQFLLLQALRCMLVVDCNNKTELNSS